MDTWLARALHERGLIELPVLQELLAQARARRGDGAETLARSILLRGLVGEQTLEGVLAGLEPPDDAAKTTDTVGGYRLLRLLGAGGMGRVYVAEHMSTGARRAVKTLPAHGDPEFSERFRREGEAQARVDRHPNVVRVHALGQDRGRLYLVLDLIEGEDLDSRLKRGPLDPTAAATLTRDLALGLAHVHAKGVLHRDLKPANVLLDKDGTPKLVDFGLARVSGAGNLTQTGTILGTPAYMSPEQVEGRRQDIDERTDVYGLGALLYHCLTGQPPFVGSSALAIMSQVARDEPPPLRNLAAGVPPELELLCHRALAKDSAVRPQSAAAFADALDRCLSSATRGARPATLALAVSAAVLVLAGSAGAYVLTRPEPRAAIGPPPESAAGPTAHVEDTGGEEGRPDKDAHGPTLRWPVRVSLEPRVNERSQREFTEFQHSGNHLKLEYGAKHGHSACLRELGRAYVQGKYRPESAERGQGRGLLLLERAVRGGDCNAAGALALVHGSPGQELIQNREGEAGKALGLGGDEDLVLALLAIAAELDIDPLTGNAIDQFKSKGKQLPTPEDAWRRVQEHHEPDSLADSMRRAERALERIAAGVAPPLREELRQKVKQSYEASLAYALKVAPTDLAASVCLLLRLREKHHEPSQRLLGRLLVHGHLEADGARSDEIEPEPLAGVKLLFDQSLRGDEASCLELARLYTAGVPGLLPDPEAASAWRLLGAGEPNEALPPPPTDRASAWRLVRQRLPWRGAPSAAARSDRWLQDLPPEDEHAHNLAVEALEQARTSGEPKGPHKRRLVELAQQGHRGALREVGLHYLLGRDPFAQRPGLGLQLLREALRRGDAKAARTLAIVNGGAAELLIEAGGLIKDRNVRKELIEVGKELGLRKDLQLAAALYALANPNLTHQVRGPRDSGFVNQRIPDIPSAELARTQVRDHYQPYALHRSLRLAEGILDDYEAQLTPRSRELIVQRALDRGFWRTADEQLKAGKLPEAVHLLRRCRRSWDIGSRTNANRRLGFLLLFGKRRAGHAPITFRTEPLAGLYWLFQSAEAGNTTACVDLAKAYARTPHQSPVIPTPRPEVCAAYLALAGDERDTEVGIELALSTELTLPTVRAEAWETVRAALPWGR